MTRYTITLATLALVGLSLSWAPAALADEDDEYAIEEARYMELMDSYLQVSEHFVTLASNPTASVYFAIEGIVELYEERGDGGGAIAHLQRLLEQYGAERTIGVLIRFKLRDLYRDTSQPELALKELDAIIAESH